MRIIKPATDAVKKCNTLPNFALLEGNATFCDVFLPVIVTMQPLQISDKNSNQMFYRKRPINLIKASALITGF